jgi:amino acid adenylation domain-containing protein
VTLEKLVQQSAARSPSAVAVRSFEQQLTYAQLDAEANRLARALAERGVGKGDRVGIWLDKGARAVVAMQATLRLGAAYVPLDPLNPPERIRAILNDCRMRVVVSNAQRASVLAPSVAVEGGWFCTEPAGLGESWDGLSQRSAAPLPDPAVSEDELAYILYTSGSTGVPKGVCLSHRNALSFITWAAELLRARPEDRFANHAPFFFDLSVLDLYVPFLVGASVCVVPEGMAYAPRQLVDFLFEQEITVWYSVPSALILMMDHGGLLERPTQALRAVLFAGEPFPIKHLRRLQAHLGGARLLNLYGPTETNVCTFYEVHEISPDRLEPVPIGIASCGDRVFLHEPRPRSDEDPTLVGELWVEGPTVMLGYWGQPPQQGPYPTGDLAYQDASGDFVYLGRRDNMVKVRGRRIELGEIEAALLAHPDVREAGVAVRGQGIEAKLVAFVSRHSGAPMGLLEAKRHCAERLPRYMIVDEVRTLPELPRTRNGKVDRRALVALLAGGG